MGLLDDLKKKAAGAVDSLEEGVGKAAEAVENKAKEVVHAAEEKAHQAAEEGKKLAEAAEKKAGELAEAAKKKAEELAHAAEEKGRQEVEAAKKLAEAAEKKLKSAAQSVEKKAGEVVQGAKSGAEAALKKAQEAVQAAEKKAGQAVQAAGKKAAGVVQSAEKKAAGFVQSAEKKAQGVVQSAEQKVHHAVEQVKKGAETVGKDLKAAAQTVEKGAERVGGQVKKGVQALEKGAETVMHQVDAAEKAVVNEVKREAGEVQETAQAVRDGVAHTVDSAKQQAGNVVSRAKQSLGDHLVKAGEAVKNAKSLGDVVDGLAHEAKGFGGDVVQATEDAGAKVLNTAGDEAKHLAQVEAKHVKDDADAIVGGIKKAGETVVQDVKDGVEFAGKVNKAVHKDVADAKQAGLEGARAVGEQIEQTEIGKAIGDSRVGKELKMALGSEETARKTADSMVEDPTEKMNAMKDGDSFDVGDAFSAKVGKDFKGATVGVSGQFGGKVNVAFEKGKDGKPDTYTVSASEGVQLGVYGSAEEKGVSVGAETSAGATAGKKFVFHSKEEAAKAVKLLEREQMSHQRTALAAGADAGGNPLLTAVGVHSPSAMFLGSQGDNIALTKEEAEELKEHQVERTTTLGTKSSVSAEVEVGPNGQKVGGKAEVGKSFQSKTSLDEAGNGRQEFSMGESLTVSKKVTLGSIGVESKEGGAKVSVSQSQDVLSLGHTTTVGYDISADAAKKGMANPLGDTSVLGKRPSDITDDFNAEVRDGDTAYGGHAQVKTALDKNGGSKTTVKADADKYHVEGGTTSVEAEASAKGVGQIAVGYDHDDIRKTRQQHWESDAVPVKMPSIKDMGQPLKLPDPVKDAWMQLFSGMSPTAAAN